MVRYIRKRPFRTVSTIVVGAIAIALLNAIQGNIDGYVLQQIMLWPQNQQIALWAFFIIAAWTGVAVHTIAPSFAGKAIDEDFVELQRYSGKIVWQPVIAGCFYAIATLCTLYGYQVSDPSLVSILGTSALIFIVLYDLRNKEVTAKDIVLPFILVFLAVVISSLSNHSSFAFSVKLVFIVALLGGALNTVGKVLDKKRDASAIDSINYSFYSFLSLATTGTVLLLLWAYAKHSLSELGTVIATFFLPVFPYAFVLMIVVWIANVSLVQLRKHYSNSLIEVVLECKIAFVFFIAIALNQVFPDIFNTLPQTPIGYLLRLSAITLVMAAAIQINETSKSTSERKS